MGSELAVILRRASISVFRRRKDSRYGYSCLQALLAKGETLQLWQGIALSRAVDGCVFQDADALATVAEGCDGGHWCGWRHVYDAALGALVGACACILELPSVSAVVVDDFWVVVALVQVLQDRCENFWDFAGKPEDFRV